MPIVPTPSFSSPYDTVDSVLNVGRVRMNDAIVSIGGDILTDGQPFTQVMANMAWRRLQSFLANLGYSRFKKPLVMEGFPVVGNMDPASQTWLNWSEFFDGTSYYVPPNTPVLPQDLILPLRLWERITGTNSPFVKMEMSVDALPDFRKTAYNRMWLWENDTIYMPGSLYSMDIRIEYASFLPDFTTIGDVQWYQQPVPIMRCMDALAWYFCAEAAGPRDDMAAEPFIAKAENAARLNFNREVSQKQRRQVSRRSYAGRNSTYQGSNFYPQY